MHSRSAAIICALTLIVLAGCSSKPAEAPAHKKSPPPQPAAAPAASAPAPAMALPADGWVTTVFGVKKEPVKERQIPDPSGEGTVSNWVATIYRGEKVRVLERREGKLEITAGVKGKDGYHAYGKKTDWLKIEDSSKTVGWIDTRYVLSGPDITPATVLTETKTFQRPDLLALAEKQDIAPGTLLFVLHEQGDFAEVNFTPTRTTWVQKKDLVFDAREIMLARMIEKLRYLQRKGKTGEMKKLLELAKESFKDTKLFSTALAPFEQAAQKEDGG